MTRNLEYREGVRFHRSSAELQLIRRQPWRVFGCLHDCLDPRGFSDFDWRDIGPHAPLLFPAGPAIEPVGAPAVDLVPPERVPLAA